MHTVIHAMKQACYIYLEWQSGHSFFRHILVYISNIFLYIRYILIYNAIFKI